MALNELLACPECKSVLVSTVESQLSCSNCNLWFPVNFGIPCFVQPGDSTKADIQRFWDTLLKSAYDEAQFGENYQERLIALRQLFEARRHLAAVEIDLDELEGKTILEIGCGAGAFSSLFSMMGAHLVSLDITPSRALMTEKNLSTICSADKYKVLNADAEHLPLADESIDIIFSNGVLHHTVDTSSAIDEIFRVLKPGGFCAVMLYAKHSYLYWINLVLLRGLVQGNIFKKGTRWLGAVTEWMSEERQTYENPITKVYSVNEIHQLFKDFKISSIRKSSFVFQQVPYIGWGLSKLLSKFTIVNNAGHLIYGHPWRHETFLELWLGRFIGFNLNIHATKSKQ